MSVTSGTTLWLRPILDCPQLDGTDTLLMVALADRVNDDDECWVGIETLASCARCSYVTARRRLAALEQRGYIARTRRRRSDGNLSTYTCKLQRAPLLTEYAARLALSLSDDQRSPGGAMTSAHHDERAEVSKDEVHSGEEDALCALLAERVAAHGKVTRPVVSNAWRRDMSLLLRRGAKGHEPEPIPSERVARAVAYVFDNLAEPDGGGFCWADQVRSPGALRRHWTQLVLAAKRHEQSKLGRGGRAVAAAAAREEPSDFAVMLDDMQRPALDVTSSIDRPERESNGSS